MLTSITVPNALSPTTISTAMSVTLISLLLKMVKPVSPMWSTLATPSITVTTVLTMAMELQPVTLVTLASFFLTILVLNAQMDVLDAEQKSKKTALSTPSVNNARKVLSDSEEDVTNVKSIIATIVES